MYLFFVATHIVLSLLLVLIIIVQPGKGGDVGAAFGGAGGSTIFGPRGPSSVLQWVTTGVAVGFMVTSITLAWFSNKALLAGGEDVLDEIDAAIEAKEKAAAQPAVEPVPAELVAPAEELEMEPVSEEPVGEE